MVRSAAVLSPPGKINLLLSATGIAIIGQGMALTAAPLLAADLSRDPLAVSAVTAATYAAVLLLGLPAGALVDRWPLQRVMVVTDLTRFVILAAFTALVWLGYASIPLLVLVVFLVGVGNSFFDPAAQAAIPGVVGRDPTALARANGKLWAIDTFGRGLAGPPLGALAFAAAAALPFGAQGVAFLCSALLLLRLAEPRPVAELAPSRSLRTEMREGVTFLVRHVQLRVLTLGMASFNFGYNIAFAPLVLFVQDRLGLDNLGFGILVAVAAVGGVAGGWVAPRLPKRLSPVQVYAIALGIQAVAWTGIAAGRNPIIAGVGLFLVGLVATVVSVVGGSARQLLTPDDKLGRVVAATRVVGIGSAAIGALVGGTVADQVGLVDASLFAAGAVLLAAALAFVIIGRRR
jgi:MFS family permease